MSILERHFSALRKAKENGKEIASDICWDVDGTLLDHKDQLSIPLMDFALWAGQTENQHLASQRIITGGNDRKATMRLNRTAFLDNYFDKINILLPGRKEPFYKNLRKFNMVAGLLIDDRPEPHELQLVVTHWNPNNSEVKAFFENKEYEGLNLSKL